MTKRALWMVMTLILLCLPATAQHSAKSASLLPASLASELERLRQAALASDYAYRQTAYLTNNIGPRLSGSPQAQMAVEYVAEQMRSLGLEVRQEPVTVPHWVRGEERAELVRFRGSVASINQKIVLTALGGSVATPPQGLEAEVVVVRSFAELEALPSAAVRGKIVLFNVSFDAHMAAAGYGLEAYELAVPYRGHGAERAAKKGAAAALVRSVGEGGFRVPHTGGMHYDKTVPAIPTAAVTAEDADLMAALCAQGAVRMHLLLTPKTLAPASSSNVVADLIGRVHPEQVVVVSGHLDSWDLGTGALDDAVGVAVAMQTANLLRQLGLRPQRTIRVVAWMNEENGLAGAKAYAQAHRAELSRHVAAIESDLGCGHPVGFFAHAPAALQERLGAVAELLRGVQRSEGSAAGADVSVLDEAGVPTFSPMQDSRSYFKYHHTAADTLDKVDPLELAENAAVVAVLAYALADMP